MARKKQDMGRTVSERLAVLASADGRNQADIAKAAGLHESKLNQILKGHIKSPTVATVGKILVALGKDWRDFGDA